MRPAARAVLLGWLLLSLAEIDPARAADQRPRAAAFELRDLSGKRVRSSDLEGKVVVVSFWATWCVPCIRELGFLEKLYGRHRDRGLVILAVATDGPETSSGIRGVVKRSGWTMPVLLDSEGSVTSVLNPRGAKPYTIFIDRRGGVAGRHEGFAAGDEAKHEAMIHALLDEAVESGTGG